MTPILMFVVFPLVTIILAAVLEFHFKSPFAVAAIIFSIFFILAFTIYTPAFLLNTIIYTILAFITAVVTRIILDSLKDQYKSRRRYNNDVNSTNRYYPALSETNYNPDPPLIVRDRYRNFSYDEDINDNISSIDRLDTSLVSDRCNCKYCRGRR